MKRFIIIFLSLLIFVGLAVAADGTKYVTATADAAIWNDNGLFSGLIIMPDGSNDVTITLYDNTAGSGTKIIPTLTFAGDGGAQAFTPPEPIIVSNGIYADITTAGTVEYTVLYRNR